MISLKALIVVTSIYNFADESGLYAYFLIPAHHTLEISMIE